MRILPVLPLLCSSLLIAENSAQNLIQIEAPLPPVFDLSHQEPTTLLPKDPRDPAQVEASRLAWERLINDKKDLPSLRLRLPETLHRTPMLLAAAQALKAKNPKIALYLAFQPGSQPIWDENAWGNLQGGILTPEDLGQTPEAWRERLMRAQELMPGRPWFLWLGTDPMAYAAALLGDGGRLVIPAKGPGERLANALPADLTEIEGGLGDLTLRHPRSGERRRWRFQDGEWKQAEFFKARNEVAVEAKANYDVGTLMAKVRATQLRDRAAIRSSEAKLDVDLHMEMQVLGSSMNGIDLGFSFTSFEAPDSGEELLQKDIRFNGMKANHTNNVQVPLVESKASMAIPVALSLTERFRYSDGGPGSKAHLRRIRFEPVDSNGELPSGELLVDEGSGRILEERSRRSDLPGMVKSEQRVLTYGEPAPGLWRLVNATTFERWIMISGLCQVQRKLTYSGFRLNQEDFNRHRQDARLSNGTMLKQTPEGVRYYNLKNGQRQIDEKPKSSGMGIGGMLLLDPSLSPPVFPMAGLAYFDFNAFNKGIQINAVTGVVFNQLSLAIPRIPLGFNLAFNINCMLYPITERPVVDGKLLEQDGVARQWANTSLALGRDLGLGFHVQGKGTLTYNRFCNPREEKYRTPDFALPPSGLTNDWRASLAWQHSGFQVSGNYGVSHRPWGRYGTPDDPQEIPDEGHMTSWGGSVSYDLRFAKAWWLHGEAGYATGKGFDRFNSLGVGGYVKGIRSYSVVADRLNYEKLGIVLPSSPLFRLSFSLDHARARCIDDMKTYGFTGVGVAGDLPGFWWFTSIRVNVGAGIQSDIPGVKGVNGMIMFLRVF